MSYHSTRKSRPAGAKKYYANKSRRGKNKQQTQSIHPDKFINKTTKNHEVAPYVPTHVFKDFGFDDALQTNIDAAGFIAPSAIQDETIPLALAGNDVIGLANTGTGKTAAFLLPVLQKLNRTRSQRSVLIMAPTRELAQQIDEEFRKFSAGMKLYSALCVGGVNIGSQIRQLRRRPHIVIGTPGRLKDLLQQNILELKYTDTLVLDEADRMLDMGFINDIREIVNYIPAKRQTLCFSATMSNAVRDITNEFMTEPDVVSVKVRETSDHIYQDVVHFKDKDDKHTQLLELLNRDEFKKVIVFGETKFGMQRLSDKLIKHGISSEAIHGNKSQGQRTRALNAFKSEKANVLVATDVAARGLDIPNVTHVINFDQPKTYDDYVHRIGRTGRGSKTGVALTFVKK